MTAGLAARWVGAIAAGFVIAGGVAAAEPAAEVRVRSGGAGPATASDVVIRTLPDVTVVDRTPGAQPATAARGPASVGTTFSDEITLFLRGGSVPRAASVEVSDQLVSAIRLFPERDGTTVVVFIRQPVTYTVSRPSAAGDVTLTVRARTQAAQMLTTLRGRTHVQRPEERGTGEVSVDAESLSYEQGTNTLIARGSVTLTRGDFTLRADEVRYDRDDGTADAVGHVVLTDPESSVEGDAAHLDLDDETGWMETATGQMRLSGFSLQAERVEKVGGPVYEITKGTFTTCNCGGLETPSWSIGGGRTKVKLGGVGTLRDATFRVKDVPVLYFPYFFFPANSDRSSGFLIPRVGYSNKRGFQYEQPYYWAINKSMDATIAFDLETAARVGVVGEYRYKLSQRARGALVLAYYNQQIGGLQNPTTSEAGTPVEPTPVNRFLLAGRHDQPFFWKSQFYVDLFAISDDNFLRDIDSFGSVSVNDLTLRTTRATRSRTGVIKTWDQGLLQLESSYAQDLVDPQDLALQKLPRILGEQGVPLLGNRVVGRFVGQATNFQRDDGYAGLRADLAPELFVPFHVGSVLSGSLRGRLRETAYHLTDDEQVAFVVPDSGNDTAFRVAPEAPNLDTNHTREIAEVYGRLGTEFSRVFDFRHLGLEKVRHSIEPELRYLWVPKVDQELFTVPSCDDVSNPRPGRNCATDATLYTKGYLFDEIDAINHRSFFSYGITTRLFGRGPTAAEAEHASHPEEEPTDVAPVVESQLAPGLPASTIPDFVGPPAPPPPGAPAAPARELVRASILHGYDVTRDIVDDSHQADVDLGIRVTPVDWAGLSYAMTTNVTRRETLGQTVGLFLREPWWRSPGPQSFQSPSTLGLSYRFVADNANAGIASSSPEARAFTNAGVEGIDGSLYLRLGEYIGFTFLSRYALNDTVLHKVGEEVELGPGFIERDYLFRIISRCNCWVLDFGLQDRVDPTNALEREKLFRIQVTLVGLGQFGQGTAPGSFIGLAPLTGLGYRRPGSYGGGLY